LRHTRIDCKQRNIALFAPIFFMYTVKHYVGSAAIAQHCFDSLSTERLGRAF